jgi:6-phosphogluconate dehydrogenase
MRGGHRCVVYDRSSEAVERMKAEGARGVASIDEIVRELKKPRAVWLMLPAGDATEDVVNELAARLEPGDTLVDGGNSHYTDDVRRAKSVTPKGIRYMDAGTSGGIWGLERGYCLMIGGPEEASPREEGALRAPQTAKKGTARPRKATCSAVRLEQATL